jgi:hypothetical protein
MIDQQSFTAGLLADGFDAPIDRSLGLNGNTTEHSHPFEVRALVLEGAITLIWDGKAVTFGPGEVFHMDADFPHAEEIGPDGVRYLVGRKTI